jgi:NAD(P)-dependent dehydrogenase (short-subunit alcohol dehydrogenase family)
MTERFARKVAIVTGAARGLGAGIGSEGSWAAMPSLTRTTRSKA